MARLPQPGGDAGNWGEILNDFLAQSIANDGSIKQDSVGSSQLKSHSVTADKLSTNAASNGQLLAYDAGDLKWVSASSGGAISSDDITDASNIGKDVLVAPDAPAIRAIIGAGTSNLTLGTTSSTAKAGDYQPTADQITETSTNKVLTAAERTKLSGITAGATVNATDAQLRDRSTHTGTQAAATITGLSTVATSGSYNDLSNRPTIPTIPVTSVATKTGDVTLVKGDVGLGNVDNTSDALKPVSSAAKAYTDDSRIDIYNKLAPFYAAASALRNTRPIVVAIAGASVAAQITSDRWTYQFNKRLQATFPKSSGTEQAIVTLASAVTTPPSGTGIVTVNAAIGGTTTSNYLTSTTRSQLMNLHPSVIIHADMPANDYGSKAVTPGQVKTNMINQLNYLDSVATAGYPYVHVVVGGYFPTITGAIAPIAEFRQAMREATEGRANTIFVDTYDFFNSIGVGMGGSDPLALLSDGLHPNANGHKVLADHVARIFNLFPIVEVAATPAQPTATAITSDNFTTDGAISGRTANAGLGGSTATWVASGAVFATSGGVLTHNGTNSGAIQIPISDNLDVQVSATLTSYTTGTNTNIELYRKATGTCYIFGIGASGTVRLALSDGTILQDYGLAPSFIIGKKLTLRYFNNKVSAYIDNVLQSEHNDTSVVRTGSGAGFSRGSGTVTATWDNFILESLA